MPECSLVVVEGLEPYLYCRNSDGSGERWNVKLIEANKYVCTTPEGYVAGKQYTQDVQAWINQNCNKGAAGGDNSF